MLKKIVVMTIILYVAVLAGYITSKLYYNKNHTSTPNAGGNIDIMGIVTDEVPETNEFWHNEILTTNDNKKYCLAGYIKYTGAADKYISGFRRHRAHIIGKLTNSYLCKGVNYPNILIDTFQLYDDRTSLEGDVYVTTEDELRIIVPLNDRLNSEYITIEGQDRDLLYYLADKFTKKIKSTPEAAGYSIRYLNLWISGKFVYPPNSTNGVFKEEKYIIKNLDDVDALNKLKIEFFNNQKAN